jgi:translation initiation factor 1
MDDFELGVDKMGMGEEAFTSVGFTTEKVHIRVQVRNRKKCITTVQGLATDLDLKKMLKALKKSFKCNGAVVSDDVSGDILQLQGDNRTGIVEFLVSEEIVLSKDSIVVHGF